MRKPIFISRLIQAFAACLAATLLAAPGAPAAAETAKPEYEVVDGAVLVFGHRLETENPLPKIGDCEDCGAIGFHRSPDGQWILIESDIRFTANDIWLYDTKTRAMPRHVVDKRRGRHLETNWFSNRIFEVRWSGMGYSSSLLFDVENPVERKALSNLLLYDSGRDVYVRYRYNKEMFAHEIEIGSVFSPGGEAERFPVALDVEYLSDAIYRFESVEIGGMDVVVTYDTKARGRVEDRFSPRVLSGAR